MTYRQARRGAAIAGAFLFAMPVVEIFYGMTQPGVVHFVVGTLGLGLVALASRL